MQMSIRTSIQILKSLESCGLYLEGACICMTSLVQAVLENQNQVATLSGRGQSHTCLITNDNF